MPSGSAQSGMRGRLPVDMTTASAPSSCSALSATLTATDLGPRRRASTSHHSHPLRAEELLDGTLQPRRDVPYPLAQSLVVDVARRSHRRETEPSHPAGKAEAAGGGDHGFGRDAVPEVGGAPDDVALDQGDPRPEAGRPARSLVACRSSSDDHDIGHGRSVTAGPSRREVLPPEVMSHSRQSEAGGRMPEATGGKRRQAS